MGCQIIHGNQGEPDGMPCAVLFCSTTMTAFGPVMGSDEEAQAFIRFVPGDPRNHPSAYLNDLYSAFVTQSVCECGEVRRYECGYCDLGEPLDASGMHHEEGEEPIPCEIQEIREDGERFICERCAKKRKVAA